MANFIAPECCCTVVNNIPPIPHFQDYRSHLRKTHPSYKDLEDHNLTDLSPNPEIVFKKIDCSRNRDINAQHVSLNNVDHTRQAELSEFVKVI